MLICAADGIAHRLTRPNDPGIRGQLERMTRAIRDATVKRRPDDGQDRLRGLLADVLAAHYVARSPGTLGGLTPDAHVCKTATSAPARYKVDPVHQMPGRNT